MPETTTQIHVFHYPTYSLLWHLTTQVLAGCVLPGDHLHTPQGLDVDVLCASFLTRKAAERFIAGAVTEHSALPRFLGPVEVFRHRDEAADAAG
jgi:hypothetical protein